MAKKLEQPWVVLRSRCDALAEKDVFFGMEVDPEIGPNGGFVVTREVVPVVALPKKQLTVQEWAEVCSRRREGWQAMPYDAATMQSVPGHATLETFAVRDLRDMCAALEAAGNPAVQRGAGKGELIEYIRKYHKPVDSTV